MRLPLSLTVAAVLALAATAPAALAQTTKPRLQADSIPGSYIQPEPVWLPVQARTPRARPIYQGLTLRFHPTAEGRVRACIMAPQFVDWIIVDFNADPPPRADFEDLTKMRNRIETLITARIGRGVLRMIEVLSEHQAPDMASQDLTLACK